MAWLDNSSDETAFRVERRLGAGAFAAVGSSAADVTTYTDSTVLPARTYEYRVFALNGGGDSGASNSVQVLIPDDHANDRVGATPLSFNVPAAGTIEVPSDRDVFAVHLGGGVTYDLRTATTGDTTLEVLDAGGAQLGANDDESAATGLYNARLSFRPAVTGTYYLRVGGGAGTTPSYTLTVAVAPPPSGAVVYFGENFPAHDKSVIWVLDMSGSMAIAVDPFVDYTGALVNGSRLDRLVSETIVAIDALPNDHLFNVVLFDECASSVFPARVLATAGNKALARTHLLALSVAGWTNTSLGVSTALSELTNRTVILVSDGSPNFLDCAMTSVGTPQDHANVILAANSQGAYVHAVGLGVQNDPTSRAFLQLVASTNASLYLEVQVTGTPAAPPVAPSGLSALAAGVTQVDLTWTDNSTNEGGFRVQRREAGALAWTWIGFLAPNSTTFSDTTALGGSSYEYQVVSELQGVVSPPSNLAAVQTPPSSVVAPSNLVGAPAHALQVDLSWTDNSTNELGFRVQRRLAGSGSFNEVASLAANLSSYQDASVSANTAYDYRVLSRDAQGNSAPSNVVTVTTPVLPPPAAPTSLAAVAPVHTGVFLTWVDNALVESGFRVERAVGAGAFAVHATLPANTTSYTDGSVSPVTSYSYRVLATNAAGASGASNTATVTLPPVPVPAPPTSLVATPVNPFRVDLAWADNSSDEVSFRVERRLSGTVSTLASVPADSTSYSDTSAQPTTTYEYRVVAVGAFAEAAGSWSSATTPVLPLPPPATSLTATASSSTTIDLAWQDNAPFETGTRVERREPPGAFAPIGVAPAGATAHVDTTAQPATAYEYRVVVSNLTGDASPSNVSSATTYAAPTLTGVSPAQGPLSGGTTVTLTGTGFSAFGATNTTVSFGGVVATGVVVLSDTQVTATAPTGSAPGLVDLVLRNSIGTTGTLPQAYRYVNHALSFDGDDTVFLGHHDEYALGTTATIECWLKLSSYGSGQEKIFTKWKNGSNEDKTLELVAGRLRLTLGGTSYGAQLTTRDPLPLNRWVHVAAVLDTNGTRIYVGGKLKASSPMVGNPHESSAITGVPRLGQYTRDGTTYPSLRGLLDEFRISRVARYTGDFTPAKRLSSDASTVVLHHLDEGTGLSVSDSSPVGSFAHWQNEPLANRPAWATEDIVTSDVDLEARVEVSSKRVTRGQTGVGVQVVLANQGATAANVTSAALLLGPGQSASRTDSVTSVAAGGQETLTFEVALDPAIALGYSTLDARVVASDALNGVDVSLEFAKERDAWTVVGWQDFGGSATGAGVSQTPAAASTQPSLAVDPVFGRSSVAWVEAASGTTQVYFKRWTGAAFEELAASGQGGGISGTAGTSRAPRVALTRQNTPFVVWEDETPGFAEIYLRTWSGAGWVELGGSGSGGGVSNSAQHSRAPVMALDPSGHPVVAWQEDVAGNTEVYLRRWTGSAWAELGGSASGGGVSNSAGASASPSLALQPNGDPVLAWIDSSSGQAEVYLKLWNGAAWVELGGSASGGGVSATSGVVSEVTLGVDREGLPTLAWSDDGSGTAQIYLRRWTGSAWEGLLGSEAGSGLSATAGASTRPRLKLDLAGRPCLVWEESGALLGARWNDLRWLPYLTDNAQRDLSGTTGASSEAALDLDPRGRAVVAWADTTSSTAPEIYLQEFRGVSLVVFEDFNDANFVQRFALNGNAVQSGTAIRLTDLSFDHAGSVFLRDSLDLRTFRASFTFNQNNGGADGLTLTFAKGASPNLVGGPGGGLGATGLDGYSFEFDTWPGDGDLNGNHVGLTSALNWIILSQQDVAGLSLSSTTIEAEVRFEAGRGRVYLESASVARTQVLDTTLAGFDLFEGYLGITAGTGAAYSRHQVDDLLIVVDCP